jgi:hypothetical protein
MISLWYEGELEKFLKDIFTEPNFKRAKSLLKADFILVPHPAGKGTMDKDLNFITRIQRNSIFQKKPYLVFFIDDVENRFPDGFGITFRTSFHESEQHRTVCLPSFRYDLGDMMVPSDKKSIGFCGFITHPARQEVIVALKEEFEMDTIIRDKWYGFYTPAQKSQFKREFIQNMEANPFQLCIRGAGNFSHRLYETLMFGRIPVILDTDSPFPCSDEINWEQYAIISNTTNGLKIKLNQWISSHDLERAQRDCRKLWENYFSRQGFGDYLHRFLSKCEFYLNDIQ